MALLGYCEFCFEPVLDTEPVAWPITGWEAERSQGGANQIIGRKRLEDGRIAHVLCAKLNAEKERRGIHREQGSLI